MKTKMHRLRTHRAVLFCGVLVFFLSMVFSKTLMAGVQISSGAFYSLSLKSDGTVWAWGWNYYGPLGDGSSLLLYWMPHGKKQFPIISSRSVT